MGILFFWVLFAVLVAMYASKLNRSAFAFFIVSALLSPLIAWIILLIIGNKEESKYILTKKCPMCAEAVLADAKICKHCKHEF